jgi:Protein of unknown function (DUF1203)
MPIAIQALPTGEPVPAPTTTVVIADAPDAYPCRRCLTDALPGERLLLLEYDPFGVPSPYTGHGPVFVHADGCEPFQHEGEIPAQLRRRLLAVRAYDDRAMMRDCGVVEGEELDATLTRMLDDPDAAYVHVHYAKAGCFACRVSRA